MKIKTTRVQILESKLHLTVKKKIFIINKKFYCINLNLIVISIFKSFEPRYRVWSISNSLTQTSNEKSDT